MITITGNSLAELEQQLADLRRQATMPQGNTQVALTGMRAKLFELKRRLTRTTGRSWALVKAVAARNAPCTLDELAAELGFADSASVHSLLALIGRPCSPKRLDLKVIENIGGNPTKYRMSDEVRQIVLELG